MFKVRIEKYFLMMKNLTPYLYLTHDAWITIKNISSVLLKCYKFFFNNVQTFR